MQEEDKRLSLELSSLEKRAACIYIHGAFVIAQLFQKLFDYFEKGKTEDGVNRRGEMRKLSAEEANGIAKEVASYIYFSTVKQVWEYRTGGLSEDDAKELLDHISTLFCTTYYLGIDSLQGLEKHERVKNPMLQGKLEEYGRVENPMEQFSRNILKALKEKDMRDLMVIVIMVTATDMYTLLPGISRMFTLSESEMAGLIEDYFMNYYAGILYRKPCPRVEERAAASAKWEEFAGKKNTKDNALRKASALAETMTWLLGDAVKEMQQPIVSQYEGIEMEDGRWWSVYYDSLLYMMHIADREAVQYLEEEERSIFREQLFKEVTEICCADFHDEPRATEFKQNFAHIFMLFQDEFASYKQGQANYLAENVTYQFAKRIQSRLGQHANFILGAQVFWVVVDTEAVLNIPVLLDDRSC